MIVGFGSKRDEDLALDHYTLLVGDGKLPAYAHMSSNAFYTIDIEADGEARITMDLDLRDIHAQIPLDADNDGAITWGEVSKRRALLYAFAARRLTLSDCSPLAISEMQVNKRLGTNFLHFRGATTCAQTTPSIAYTGFLDIDTDHAGLFRVATPVGEQNIVMSARHRTFDFSEPRTAWWFAVEGVWHILIGFDHIIFLLLLLLPTVIQRETRPPLTFGLATKSIVWVVSAFTVGHSITLGLAASDTFTLPAHIVEPAIALTIVLAAINNVAPFMRWPEAWIAGFFGTIHGFGFASVLGELGVASETFWVDLLAFNVGVEIGQIGIVTLCLPLIWYARRFAFYHKLGVPVASLAASALAILWFFERLPG